MATIRKRGDRWQAIVRKAGFKAQSDTFDTKARASAWAKSMETEMEKGNAPDISALRKETVQAVLERFRDEECPNRKGGRWEQVRINAFIKRDQFIRMRLDQDIPGALRDWIKLRGQDIAPSSLNRELNILSGIFSHAIKSWGIPLKTNPVHQVKRPKESSRGREITWTPEDIAKVKAVIGPVPFPPRFIPHYIPAMMDFAVESAMRISEICAIETANVHLDEAWLRIGDSKNGDARNVPLSTRAIEILRPFVELNKKNKPFPVNVGSFGVRFREVTAAAGLGHKTFHDTRHTAATNLSKKLSNVLELSAVTGHRSLQSLKRYYNPNASDLAAKLG